MSELKDYFCNFDAMCQEYEVGTFPPFYDEILKLYNGFNKRRTNRWMIKKAKDVLAIFPEAVYVWEILANAQYDACLWKDSIASYEHVWNNFRNSMLLSKGDLFWNLAWANSHLKNYKEEEKYYRKILDAGYNDEDFIYLNNNLGYCLYRQKRYEEAEQYLRESIHAGQANKYPYENMVRVLKKQHCLSELQIFVSQNQDMLSPGTVKNIMSQFVTADKITETFDIQKIEQNIMAQLKDFQRCTVERIDYLYQQGQQRVLVADEVGLGKTLVARGVIAKEAQRCIGDNKEIFRVVYICSNQNIARQNISKLKITNHTRVETRDTRLSMQHLIITEQAHDPAIQNSHIQLIPLTPGTSFRLTNGGGIIEERALIYAILRRVDILSPFTEKVGQLLSYHAACGWDGVKEGMERRVAYLEQVSGYPKDVISKIKEYNTTHHVIQSLIQHIKGNRGKSDSQMINALRNMFAEISVKMLKPALVIMDEFQRFNSLLHADSDMNILAMHFFKQDKLRILLLSATPYKLYSTLEEIEENNNIDEQYQEFFNVMDFLFSQNDRQRTFKEIWSSYSHSLQELQQGNTTILAIKEKAENAMYQGTCRTERLSVIDSSDNYIDDSQTKALDITLNDVKSYLQIGHLLRKIDANILLPVDYVKSCPYLMSFMNGYQVKEKIKSYFMKNSEALAQIRKTRFPLLWLNERMVDQYQALPKVNARLEYLKEKVFEGNAALYLWIPPSKPYYELQGVYKNSKGYSKFLLFSAWEMVPRMIGTLVSYEAERRTIGRLIATLTNDEQSNIHYFMKRKRFPASRLHFSSITSDNMSTNLFNLLYPSQFLAGVYDPIPYINRKCSLKEIEKELKNKIKQAVIPLKQYVQQHVREDARWYYLAPMLLDDREYITSWINGILAENDAENGALQSHCERLENDLVGIYPAHDIQLHGSSHCQKFKPLGKMPHDLIQVLIDEAIASPAVCIYRSNGNHKVEATTLAQTFLRRFDAPEAIAIVELAFRRSSDESHWKYLLRYCKNGCFQAMFDEYWHIMADAVGCVSDPATQVQQFMKQALSINSVSYNVDTFCHFRHQIINEEDNDDKQIKMRTQFAVPFTKGDSSDDKNANRKEKVRNAFNSPLRPFVLATTSIGEEGLDFHNYCRKIVHWNLPSNPIDIEQREGRINRYKCLAVRQSIAEKYGDKNDGFKKNIWQELFDAAATENTQQSGLIPYWCVGDDQPVKIERIVPMYPVSQDKEKYNRLMKILSLYRLTLGQDHQEELIELLTKHFSDNDLKKLFIDLSPYSKGVNV